MNYYTKYGDQTNKSKDKIENAAIADLIEK